MLDKIHTFLADMVDTYNEHQYDYKDNPAAWSSNILDYYIHDLIPDVQDFLQIVQQEQDRIKRGDGDITQLLYDYLLENKGKLFTLKDILEATYKENINSANDPSEEYLNAIDTLVYRRKIKVFNYKDEKYYTYRGDGLYD